jgi:hypothetical protein
LPLQNRVTPYGEIFAVAARGLMMGNRGILHDDERHIVRPWQVKRWIACVLEFRGRHRRVMQPHSYTELFFLDEATAFAAGHRPCAECRRADYRRFQELWTKCYGKPVSADVMDERLHHDRLDERRAKRTYREKLGALPEGAYITYDDRAWLVLADSILEWTPAGYGQRRSRSALHCVDVLTPRSAVAVLAAGYRPAIHPSAFR